LGAELAVKDLAALLAFLATPEDDLSLAAVLRSPIFGWTEAQLYDLAQGRGDSAFLWSALRDKASSYPDTFEILRDLRDQTDFLRPYDLIERILTRHDGRRRLLSRLGPEAEDGIDALLSQALDFERVEIPSLTGFIAWMETDEVEVKRQLDTESKAIRVMTVHGAKGLEAPIVILPDTAKRAERVREEIFVAPGGPAIWKTNADESPPLIAQHVTALKERQREERMRLLYVAMTRAENWLIVCGAGDVGTETDSWYSLIDAAIDKAGAARKPAIGDEFEFGPGKRFEYSLWPDDSRDVPVEPESAAVLPEWAQNPAPGEFGTEVALSPSALGGAKALPGEAGQDEEIAKQHGTIVHLLLEHLPNWPENLWPEIAESLLSTSDHQVSASDFDIHLAEARRVLSAPDMEPLLVPEALTEVEVTGRVDELGGRLVHGTIDRLLVTPARVFAIDYKSNAVVPETPSEVPEGLLRQMGAYGAILAQIYPDRPVELAILWTRTGRLMRLDPDIVRSALLSTTIP
jgi:ATP-dependent helicase/nuclease subunit A